MQCVGDPLEQQLDVAELCLGGEDAIGDRVHHLALSCDWAREQLVLHHVRHVLEREGTAENGGGRGAVDTQGKMELCDRRLDVVPCEWQLLRLRSMLQAHFVEHIVDVVRRADVRALQELSQQAAHQGRRRVASCGGEIAQRNDGVAKEGRPFIEATLDHLRVTIAERVRCYLV